MPAFDKNQTAHLGTAIRKRRKALGMTLVTLAQQTNLTTGFISQIERDISAPSFSSIMRIASALQTSIEQLLSLPETFAEYVAKDARQTYSLGEAGRQYEKLGPGFHGALMYPCIIHRPAGHISEQMCHKGEVFCHLQSGQLEYHLGDEIHIINAGDSIHHDTNKPHYSRVLGAVGSIELWVSSSPINTPM